MKRTPGPASPASSRAKVSLTRGLPLPGSSPIESRPTRGSAIPKRCLANAEPIWANCTSQAALHSALAPASSSTVGVVPGTGIGVAMAGRATPRMRPIRSRALAMVAPVLPALTMAAARAVADRLGGPDKRRVLLGAHRPARVLVHLDDLPGRDDRQPAGVAEAVRDRRPGRPPGRPRRPGWPRRRSRPGPGRRPWRRPRPAADPAGGSGRSTGRRGPGGCRVQPTSMAWRPLYHPQVGHTTCGSLALWHWGRRCGRGHSAPRRWPAGCGSWPWRSSSWGRPCRRGFLCCVWADCAGAGLRPAGVPDSALSPATVLDRVLGPVARGRRAHPANGGRRLPRSRTPISRMCADILSPAAARLDVGGAAPEGAVLAEGNVLQSEQTAWR